jgi:dTDP-4-amino-4,6-dideoxygalactose transaminase
MDAGKKINVTQPFLPPLEEFNEYLQQIWDSKWLTNGGQFHKELEQKLCEYLGVKYISLFANGTLALITALQTLKITGEVITTPYSFVATTHSLWWNGIKPVFVDIEPDFCNLNPAKIEAAITPKTTAILPVHVYGNPCKVDEIQNIADIYGLKVIYDAAHSFGVKYKNQSILNFGDLSVLSFHATKVFNTFEGGAIICHDEKTKRRIDYLKNFGFADETIVIGTGMNAKMNEVQAAFGLLNLKYLDLALEKRKQITDLYVQELYNCKGIRYLNKSDNTTPNYAYFPIFINQQEFGISRDELYNKLKEHDIHCRRYFYPLISNFQAYRGLPSSNKENLQTAEQLANEVLCLPIYPDLDSQTVLTICKLITSQ